MKFIDAVTKFAGEAYAIQAHAAEWNAQQFADVPVRNLVIAHAGLTKIHPEGGYAISGDDIAINWGRNA